MDCLQAVLRELPVTFTINALLTSAAAINIVGPSGGDPIIYNKIAAALAKQVFILYIFAHTHA